MFSRAYRLISKYLPHEVGLVGDYGHGNMGDLAVGQSLRDKLRSKGISARMFASPSSRINCTLPTVGGGGVLHDWFGHEYLEGKLDYAADSGAIVGVGVPGIRTKKARQIASSQLQETHLITVRDERSRRQLLPLTDRPVHTTADPAFLLSPSDTAGLVAKTGVNFRPWFRLDDTLAHIKDYEEGMSYYLDYDKDSLDTAEESYIDSARRIISNLPNPVFIPFTVADEQFAREHFDIEVLPFRHSVNMTLNRVNSVSRMVAMRYHSLVFAAVCGIPCLAINYDPKVGCLADRLQVAHFRPHEAVTLSFEQPSNVDQLRGEAQKNIELLLEILD